jgi:hypothetical protein
MARAAFPIADRVLLAAVGEYMKQKNGFNEGLARDDVQAALVGGCRVELIWFKEGREVCREYPDEPDFWRRPILTWHGVLPRQLHVQLPQGEQKGDQLLTFLCLTDAVRFGLRPASELPQAKQQSEQPPQQPSQKRKTVSADAQSQPQPRASRRRRDQGSGPQTLRARVVLNRLYGGPEKYPPRDEVSDADLLDRFTKEYEKVEGKANPPSKYGRPSKEVVLRETLRKD